MFNKKWVNSVEGKMVRVAAIVEVEQHSFPNSLYVTTIGGRHLIRLSSTEEKEAFEKNLYELDS